MRLRALQKRCVFIKRGGIKNQQSLQIPTWSPINYHTVSAAGKKDLIQVNDNHRKPKTFLSPHSHSWFWQSSNFCTAPHVIQAILPKTSKNTYSQILSLHADHVEWSLSCYILIWVWKHQSGSHTAEAFDLSSSALFWRPRPKPDRYWEGTRTGLSRGRCVTKQILMLEKNGKWLF